MFLRYLLAGSKTVKFILRDFIVLHYLGVFLLAAAIDSGFQEILWFRLQCNGVFLNNLPLSYSIHLIGTELLNHIQSVLAC